VTPTQIAARERASAYMDWLFAVSTANYPDEHAESLRRLNVNASTWPKVARFLTGFASKYGTYGEGMYPGLETVRTDFGGSPSKATVSRWLNAAVLVGYLEVVRPGARFDPTEYRTSLPQPTREAFDHWGDPPY